MGVKGNAGQSNYSASKAGINGFTKSIALELGSRNIRCNAIAPGFIETDMTNKGDGKLLESWIESIPLKRAGHVEDIANLCVYLASEKGRCERGIRTFETKTGGICLNWGCIPTKALLKSAQVFDYVSHSADYGINIKDSSVDFDSIINRSRGVADGMSKGVNFLMKKNKIVGYIKFIEYLSSNVIFIS